MSSGREVTSVNEYPTADGNVGAAGGRDVLYAQVCPLDLPYRAARLFDYKVPTELRGVLRRGDFVTVPFGQGEELHDELEKAGCDVTLLSIEDADHADLHFFQKEVWDEICAFFRAKL